MTFGEFWEYTKTLIDEQGEEWRSIRLREIVEYPDRDKRTKKFLKQFSGLQECSEPECEQVYIEYQLYKSWYGRYGNGTLSMAVRPFRPMWPAMAVLVPALIISAIVLLVLASDIQSGNLWIRIMIALIPITAVTVVLCLFASDIAGKHEQEKMYRFVRRVLGVYLVTTPNCGNCEYSLLGLPVEAEKATGRLRVVCPECGAANIPPRQQLVPAEESA